MDERNWTNEKAVLGGASKLGYCRIEMKKRGESRIEGFHLLSVRQRREVVAAWVEECDMPAFEGALTIEMADKMVENAIAVFGVPFGVAPNFLINGKEMLVPMAIEEPSVVAGASNAARMVRHGSGFAAQADPPLAAAQIEILDPCSDAQKRISDASAELMRAADETQPELVSLGGGAREIVVREAVGKSERLVVHLLVDCVDAMGANAVNTMAEAIAPRIAEISGGRKGLCIVTNLADRRLARASCEVPFGALERRGFSGEAVAAGVAAASDFALDDPYRAATHNKGIFNGIDALLVATGNDWRAVEAGGHAYAARGGKYGPLSSWNMVGDRLVGSIEMPMMVGIAGGASKVHPLARFCLKLMGVERGSDLARIAVSVGLASNLAALSALCSEGIQEGHMRLHRRKLGRE